ncbi:hypothetical protein FQN57_003439 [Myotisia sp. PD_48]|nr:hypothetical protein FQN57_003439 [Myotisia sp. PD_48]
MKRGTTYKPYDQIILFGDSITEWSEHQDKGFAFATTLRNAYLRRVDVINRGLSGYDTNQALKILPQIWPPKEVATVRLMTIFFGANDAELQGPQFVPLNVYQQNLTTMIQAFELDVQTKVLLLTPPPINEYQLDKSPLKGSRSAENTKRYADACRKVGEECGKDSNNVAVVDIWSAFMAKAGWKEGQPLIGSKDVPENAMLAALLTDGLHFSPNGYKIMYHEVMKVIAEKYPLEMPEERPYHFPRWNAGL